VTLNYVTLTLDLYDGQGNPVIKGEALFTPTVQLTDTTDHQEIVLAPVPCVFHGGGLPAVKLLATDNTAPLPGGWGWTVSFTGVAGNPAGFTFLLPYASGSAQYLSSQAPVTTTTVQYPQVIVIAASGDTTGATDYANINSTLGSNVKISLQAGQFWVNQPITPLQDAWTWIDGAGDGLTVISPAAAANCDVIKSGGFAALTNTGTGTVTGAGPFLQLSNLTIDGNRSNQTLTALGNSACNPATPPSAGYGIRLYGRNWKIVNVDVRNCFAYGIWTEWGTPATSSVYQTGSVEGRAVSVKVHENGAHGWYHRGPSDCQLVNVLCFRNNQAALNAGLDFWAEGDNVTNGSGTSHFTPNGLQLSNSHFWGQAQWNCVLDCNTSASNCHAEGGQTGAALFRGNVKWSGGSPYYISSQAQATGCGVQFGDAGATAGVPTTASYAAQVAFTAVITGVLADVAARAGIVWASASQSLVKAVVLTKTVPTGSVAAGSNGQTLPQSSIAYTSGTTLPPNGVVSIADTGGPDTVTYTGNTGSSLTGCTGGTHTLATGNTITLANVGTVAVTGAIDAASDVAIEVNGSGLGSGVAQAASYHYAKGKHRLDVGSQALALNVTNAGTDALNVNTANSRVEGPNGYEWRLYADAYTTAVIKLGGATGHIGTALPNGKTLGIAAAAGAGSSPPTPTLQSLASDAQGQVNMGTGTSPTSGSQATITFGTAFGSAPVIVLSPVNAATAALQPYVSSASASSFNIAFAVAPAASQSAGTYVVNYVAIARGS
jgi:hypothetical protein